MGKSEGGGGVDGWRGGNNRGKTRLRKHGETRDSRGTVECDMPGVFYEQILSSVGVVAGEGDIVGSLSEAEEIDNDGVRRVYQARVDGW